MSEQIVIENDEDKNNPFGDPEDNKADERNLFGDPDDGTEEVVPPVNESPEVGSQAVTPRRLRSRGTRRRRVRRS